MDSEPPCGRDRPKAQRLEMLRTRRSRVLAGLAQDQEHLRAINSKINYYEGEVAREAVILLAFGVN